jgi:hypothetical protein
LLCRPISEELAVALRQGLALEGRKRLAELISACVPHASNRLGISSSKTPHEQGVVAEVLLQIRPRPNTRAMLAGFHTTTREAVFVRGRENTPTRRVDGMPNLVRFRTGRDTFAGCGVRQLPGRGVVPRRDLRR